MRSIRRRAGLAATGLAMALAACGGGGDGPAGEGRGGAGQVVIGEGADLSKPNPIIGESELDNFVNAMLYRPILGTRWENGELLYQTADENPIALARSYEFFGPDSASIRYRLRSDVRWSDGTPLTAHDAAFTLRAQGMEEVASPRQDYSREMRDIVVEDDSTLVIHFTRRYPEIFFHTAGAVMPRHVYEGTDLSQIRSHPSMTDPAANLVTSGPMRLTEWIRGQRVVLQPNPDFEPTPQVTVVWRVIPEQTTRIIELQTGNLDITPVPFNFVEEVRAADHLRIEVEEKRSYEYIAYNPQAHDFFTDLEVRKALSMSIDRQELIEALQMGEWAVPAGGPYAPIFRRLYDPEGQAPLPYDTAQARQILAAEGWTRGTDGILTKDGEPFRFTIMTNGDNQRRVDIAQIVQQQWGRLGIDVQIQTMEFNTVIERTQNKEYEAMIGGWGVGLSADLHQLWGDPDLPFNFVSYDNPEVQALFQQATEQPTEEMAAPYWQRGASLIAADHPYSWLYYHDRLYGVNNRVTGLRVDTLSPYQEVWNWRVES